MMPPLLMLNNVSPASIVVSIEACSRLRAQPLLSCTSLLASTQLKHASHCALTHALPALRCCPCLLDLPPSSGVALAAETNRSLILPDFLLAGMVNTSESITARDAPTVPFT
jgi:hypothetical protein